MYRSGNKPEAIAAKNPCSGSFRRNDRSYSARREPTRAMCLPRDAGERKRFFYPSSHGVRRLPSSRKLGGLGRLQQRGHALLVTGSGVAMDNALLGGAI